MALVTRQILTKNKSVLWTSFYFNQVLQKSCNIDKIDCFTSELVKEKALKWHSIQKNIEKFRDQKFVPVTYLTKGLIDDFQNLDSLLSSGLNVTKFTNYQIDSLLSSAIKSENESDVYFMINGCLKEGILPDLKLILLFLSRKGDINTISNIENLIEEEDNEYSLDQILPYKAYAFWNKGHIRNMTETIERCFCNSEFSFKRDLYFILKLISYDAVNNKGEAILSQMLNFAKRVFENNNDIFMMKYIWRNAFQSDWFCDQNLAIKMFEDNHRIQDVVEQWSSELCTEFLKKNNVEAVYKLIELFLKHKKNEACEDCINLLFEYSYYRRDLRTCTEIMKFLQTLDIPAKQYLNEKVLNLYLKSKVVSNKEIKQPSFQYKF